MHRDADPVMPSTGEARMDPKFGYTLRRTSVALLVFGLVGCAAPAPQAAPTAAPAQPAAQAPTVAPAAAAKPTTAPTAAAASGSVPANQNLIIAIDQSDVRTLDPAREFEFAAAFVDLNVYDTLITQKGPDDLTTYVPVLAKEWKISPDGKEYTFTLRDDVKFASGNPLTGDDVKSSLMRLKNIKGNPGWMMDPLKEVQVVDKTTVKTVLTDSFGDWLAVLSGPNSGIMDSKLVTQNGGSDAEGADQADKAEEWLNQNSAGSGPFIIKGWQKNNVITLERNPTYFQGAPKLARVDVRDVPSPATQKLQVESGDVDVALSLTPDLVDTLKGNPNVKVVLGQSLDSPHMGLQLAPALH